MPQDLPASTRESILRSATVLTGRSVILIALIGLTSLAVGATTSIWFVPPYLAAMGWLLLAPARPVEGTRTPAQSAHEETPVADAVEEPMLEVPAEPAPKPKKGRGRGKSKAKAKESPVVPPMIATWVQVAPGKFVRVEVPAPVETADDMPSEPEPTPIVVEVVEAIPDEPAPVIADGEESIQASDEVEDRAEVVSEERVPDPATEEYEEEQGTEWAGPIHADYIVVESDEIEDHVPETPPEESRLVATGEPLRSGVSRSIHGRSIRVRRDPRPKPRRGNGRIGASPRVVLHRA